MLSSTTASTSSSPTRRREVLGQELPALVKDGYTSFKVFMTYDDLVLNDRQLLDVFDVRAPRAARSSWSIAEGYDAIRFMTERLERAGKTAPYYHARVPARDRRARGRRTAPSATPN